MRLGTELPELPEGQGKLFTHNSNGEHATKYAGTQYEYNPLRQSELERLDGQPFEDIDDDNFFDMLLNDAHDLRFIHLIDQPDPNEVSGLVATSLAELETVSRFEHRMTAREVVVHPELRQRGIGSWLLTNLAFRWTMHVPNPTEFVFDTSTYRTDDWLAPKLREVGFTHTDESGSPAMWLPGVQPPIHYPWDGGEKSQEILSNIPEGFNAALHVDVSDDGSKTIVFRDGKIIGSISAGEEATWDEDTHQSVRGYKLLDAGEAHIDDVVCSDPKIAVISLLNNYDLVV